MTATTRNQILIFAPLATVRDATVTAADWPRWTRNVTSVQPMTAGPLRIGARCLLRQPLQHPDLWEVTELLPGRVLAWRRLGGMLDLLTRHKLNEDVSGTVVNVLELELSGRVAGPVRPLLSSVLSLTLSTENPDLKTWCERSDRQREGSAR